MTVGPSLAPPPAAGPETIAPPPTVAPTVPPVPDPAATVAPSLPAAPPPHENATLAPALARVPPPALPPAAESATHNGTKHSLPPPAPRGDASQTQAGSTEAPAAVADPMATRMPDAPPGVPHTVDEARHAFVTRSDHDVALGIPAPQQDLIPGYEILGELGRGGMGVVYKARQKGLNRLVALKMILSGGHASWQDLARFRAEAEAVAKLQHPHIVQIYEIGEQEGRPFFSLEFCAGGSLSDKINGQPLPIAQAATLTEKLARAMHVAHGLGIVHRDLKPANVLLTAALPTRNKEVALGEPKISDFGLVKRLGEDSGQTRSGAVMGTPSYMAPEQAQGKVKEIGPAADVYALGAILYELLTGRPPFRAEGAWETVAQVINDDPVPPGRLRPRLPRDLETICLKCLEKDPARRYASAEALADDCAAFLRREPITARPARPWERALKFARRRPALAALVAVCLLMLAGAFAGSWWVAAYQAQNAHALAALNGQLQTATETAESERDTARAAGERARLAGVQAVSERDRARLHAYAAHMGQAQIALRQARLDRLRRVLRDLEQPDYRDLRGFEWYFLNHLQQSRFRLSEDGGAVSVDLPVHTRAVTAAAFSPDGKRIATGSLDNTVKLWTVGSKEEPLTLPDGHTAPVLTVAFSPDGQRLAAAGEDGAVKVWDLGRDVLLHTLHGHAGTVAAVAFSPDGRHLASAGRDHTVRVWDLVEGKAIHTLRGHAYGVTAVAFSRDGKRIASGSWDRTVRLWNAVTGQPIGSPLAGHTHWVSCIAFSPDGDRLASAGWDRQVRLWDLSAGKEIFSLGPTNGPIRGVAFSPDGLHLAALGFDNAPHVWDLTTRREAALNADLGSLIRSGVAFSPDGQGLASLSFTQNDRFWDTTRLEDPADSASVHGTAFSPDGRRVAAASGDGSVRLWDLGDRLEGGEGSPARVLRGHSAPVRAVAFSSDGGLLASAGEDNAVRLWDPATGQASRLLAGHQAWVTALAFHPTGGMLASASEDGTVRLWNPTTGRALRVLPAEAGPVQSVAFRRDGKVLAAGYEDGSVRLWDAESGQVVRTIAGHKAPVLGIAFSPTRADLLATGSWDNRIKLWDTGSGTELASLEGHTYGVTGVSFSPDGQRLASAGADKTVKLWDLAREREAREVLTLDRHTAGVTAVTFRRDGLALASASWDGTVRLWYAPRTGTGR